MSYFLMHKDAKVALFSLVNDRIFYMTINNEKRELLPVGIHDEQGLSQWIMGRGIPVTRDGIASDLLEIGGKSTFDMMLCNLGLSLTDCYWICPVEANYNWADVNLYKNPFKSKYSLDLKDDILINAETGSFTPNASLKGDLKKKWIIGDDGCRYLIKGNKTESCRQSLCEVLASNIHASQEFTNYTAYRLVEIPSKDAMKVGCECKAFTSERLEFISAYSIISSIKVPGDQSYYESYIEMCGTYGLDIRSFMEYQIMTDFVITNVDRHFNNFGILRDSNTLEWVSAAPIFDSGNSMFYNLNYIPVDNEILNIEVNSFLKREAHLLKYVRNRGLVNMNALPDLETVYHLFLRDVHGEDTAERLTEAYNKKRRYLDDFQNGADIWSYKYGKMIKTGF